MTVYNITKVIDKSLLNSIKVYLNVNKVTILYTDLGNTFGVKASNKFYNANIEKINAINKVLWDKLSSKPIAMFTNCPKIDIHNASLIRKYGRIPKLCAIWKYNMINSYDKLNKYKNNNVKETYINYE